MITAQLWARTRLRNKYYLEFRELYCIEREKTSTVGKPRKIKNLIYSKANNAAMTTLVHRYWNEYRSLYCQAIAKGHPHTYGWPGKSTGGT